MDTPSQSSVTKLMQLRDLTDRTGMLDDLQIVQLKVWGALVSPKKKSFTIEVDLEKKSITYNFTFEKKKPAHFDRMCTSLHKSIKWLLGCEWKVVTKVGEDVVKLSRANKKEPPPIKSPNRRWKKELEEVKKEIEGRIDPTPWRDKFVGSDS